MLAQRGAAIIDADDISRSLTAAGGRAIQAIAQAFGDAFITTDGALDRDKMRALVFATPSAKQTLEGIIHPLVAQITAERAQQVLAQGTRALVFDVPLLVESARWRTQVDRVLVIDCTAETQIQRVMQRNAFSRDQILHILANQATREQRLAAADWVIFNEKLTLAELNSKVLNLPL
jgi:dephospho-CoA kinase